MRSFSSLGGVVGNLGPGRREFTLEKANDEILNREFEFSASDAHEPVQVCAETDVDLFGRRATRRCHSYPPGINAA